MRTIEAVVHAGGISNKVIWALSSFERFSCRSFRRSLALEGQISDRWKGL